MKKMYRINLIIKFKFSKNVSRYMYINIPESFFSFLDEYSIHKVVWIVWHWRPTFAQKKMLKDITSVSNLLINHLKKILRPFL